MDKIISNIIYGFLWLLSKLPFKVLYFISDIIYLFLYYIIGYRKSIVRRNLKSFFPEKTDIELKHIEKKFYKHFADLFIEMIKTFSISNQELNKRFIIENTDVIDKLYQDNKSVIFNGSHYGNWEWGIQIAQVIKHHSVGIYAQVKNKFLDKMISQNRGRFGVEMVPKQKILSKINTYSQDNKPSMYIFLSDQSPRMKRAYYWTDFLGKRVPVLTGAENVAKKYDMAMVLIRISKIKRGYYKANLELITDRPRQFPDYELTELFLEKFTEQIKEEPAYYLWTHNRHKHSHREHLKPEVGSL